MNEKGDLSEAQVKVVHELNDRDISIQIFSKRPEILRTISDFNWRSLSVDETNMDVAVDNPDLNLAVIVTDNLPKSFMNKVKKRLNVVLPVNLKGKEWSRKQVLEMYPGAAARGSPSRGPASPRPSLASRIRRVRDQRCGPARLVTILAAPVASTARTRHQPFVKRRRTMPRQMKRRIKPQPRECVVNWTGNSHKL